ncbi:MAG: flagellar basal body P-ring protein FlgI [Planctomycetota bacterium]|nr:flagellar basal body P-ring protein FlgI [Planctomycetota bacterium]
MGIHSAWNGSRTRRGAFATVMAVGPALLLVGCSSDPPPAARTVTPVVRDVPIALRGTVGSLGTFTGIEPQVVAGYGLVVGLRGTGGLPLDNTIAATMEREMGLRGIGRGNDFGERSALTNKSPRDILRDQNVAVVEVYAALPPGAPAGTSFDVYVRAINATSLEGGTLWTTDLRFGDPSAFGKVQTKRLATARGSVFINPFAEPGKTDDGITRTIGRILDGGVVTDPLKIIFTLDNPSHATARSIVSAINTRFPPGPTDAADTASGRDASVISIRVPGAYRAKPGEFIKLVSAVQTRLGIAPEDQANVYVEAIKNDPTLAADLTWCLEAVGPKALPSIRQLYENAEYVPRMAGLRAGANMGDPRSADVLRKMIQTSTGQERLVAIDMLAKVDGGAVVDMTLRELLNEKELLVRVAAYEGLAQRAERNQYKRLLLAAAAENKATMKEISPSHLELLAAAELPRGSIQGVERTLVEGKFLLDRVPFGEPLVYIAQQGRPKIVVFGDEPLVKQPMMTAAWGNRLMMASDGPGDPIRIRYTDRYTDSVTKSVLPGNSVLSIIDFLARDPQGSTGGPGLNFTYSEVVGSLYALHKTKAMNAGFATEDDTLLAGLMDASKAQGRRERPEFTGEKEKVVFDPQAREKLPDAKPSDTTPPSPIVPIAPKQPDAKK